MTWAPKPTELAASASNVSEQRSSRVSDASALDKQVLARKTEELKMKLRNSSLCKDPQAPSGSSSTATLASISSATLAPVAAAVGSAQAAAVPAFVAASASSAAGRGSGPGSHQATPVGTSLLGGGPTTAASLSATSTAVNSAAKVSDSPATVSMGAPGEDRAQSKGTALLADPVITACKVASASAGTATVTLSPRVPARVAAIVGDVAALPPSAATQTQRLGNDLPAVNSPALQRSVSLPAGSALQRSNSAPAGVALASGTVASTSTVVEQQPLENSLRGAPVPAPALQNNTNSTPIEATPGKARPQERSAGQQSQQHMRPPLPPASLATSSTSAPDSSGSAQLKSTVRASNSAQPAAAGTAPPAVSLVAKKRLSQPAVAAATGQPQKRPRLAMGEHQEWQAEFDRLWRYLAKEFPECVKHSRPGVILQPYKEDRFKELERFLKESGLVVS